MKAMDKFVADGKWPEGATQAIMRSVLFHSFFTGRKGEY